MHFTKDPLLAGLSYLCPYPDLDLHPMKKAASLLPRFTDFSNLSRKDKRSITGSCRVTKSKWTVNDETGQWVYHISADRFLWGMVRRIVGLMVMIGHGRISMSEFESNMKSSKPFRVNYKVPAEGLYLVEVKYPFIR